MKPYTPTLLYVFMACTVSALPLPLPLCKMDLLSPPPPLLLLSSFKGYYRWYITLRILSHKYMDLAIISC